MQSTLLALLSALAAGDDACLDGPLADALIEAGRYDDAIFVRRVVESSGPSYDIEEGQYVGGSYTVRILPVERDTIVTLSLSSAKDRARMTLEAVAEKGFLRLDQSNLYSHPWRLSVEAKPRADSVRLTFLTHGRTENTVMECSWSVHGVRSAVLERLTEPCPTDIRLQLHGIQSREHCHRCDGRGWVLRTPQ